MALLIPDINQVKAIFLDIDGTLVSFKTHTIPQTTLDAISAVRRAGVKVIIATGRPLPFVDNLGSLEYDGIMTVNGARCQLTDGIVIRHDPINHEDLEHLVEYCKDRPISMAFTSADEAFMNYATDEFREVFTLLDIKIPRQLPLEHCLDMDIMQLVMFFHSEEEEELMKRVLPHCSAHRWHPAFADVISRGNSKQDGVDTFCKYLGIPVSQTMAFGDGGNDVGMLCHVGFGYAMGNSKPSVLAAAPNVTDTVDNNGVAKVLIEMMKENL